MRSGMLGVVVKEADREVQKWTFDPIADLYDRVRPAYPPELVGDLRALAGLGPGARVLEIGCGTGKLTVSLAELGCEILAVELGPRLADVARRNLARFPDVEVVNAEFETWDAPSASFDAVVSATAWHWLDPSIRVSRCADLLRPDGALAIVITHHVARDEDAFFRNAQACYERWDPAYDGAERPSRPADVAVDTSEIETSGRFEPPEVRRYEWTQEYSTAEFLELHSTYSANLVLADEHRAGLDRCLADLIDSGFGGRVVKPYLNELQVARRR